jgi:hypothetical protein
MDNPPGAKRRAVFAVLALLVLFMMEWSSFRLGENWNEHARLLLGNDFSSVFQHDVFSMYYVVVGFIALAMSPLPTFLVYLSAHTSKSRRIDQTVWLVAVGFSILLGYCYTAGAATVGVFFEPRAVSWPAILVGNAVVIGLACLAALSRPEMIEADHGGLNPS